MATKKQLEEKREFARLLFMQGEQQKTIAEKTGVSQQTISSWVEKFGWSTQRAAASITRPELVNKLLLSIDRLIEQVNESDDPDAFNSLGDKLAKMSMTIERLDKKASIVDVVDTFMGFAKWLQFRAEFDEQVTPELIKTINHYHDLYITELIQSKFH